MRPFFFLLIVAALAGLGFLFYWIFFGSLEPVARQTFATAHSCPEDQLTSRERPDLKVFDLTFGPSAVAQPPAEVKNDPARLAVWEETQRQANATRDSWNDAGAVFEVEGCSALEVYVCYRWNNDGGRGNGWPFCTAARKDFLPPGALPPR